MKLGINIILFLFICLGSLSQENINLRYKSVDIYSDTIKLDSLSIIPGTVKLTDPFGEELSKASYKIDFIRSLLIPSPDLIGESLRIRYSVFPYDYSKPLFHKDKNMMENDPDSSGYNLVVSYDDPGTYDYQSSRLKRRGSISRGVTFGNNQDVIVNSNLNLQLSGKLTNDLEIQASITDNNIPIQPDGNSQQIQEFDKVFISIFNNRSNLTVGDFEITKPTGKYMNLFKKVQGGMYSTKFDLNKSSSFKTTVSGAVAKGKFNRMSFNGIEGNQGPYKLRGANNESFIIILAGTEKVYIDGKLIARGQEYDYVIDYNTGEITFTPNQPITKDKRIVVEFEYSDKNYAKFMVFNSNEFESEKAKVWLNIYSEQDSKNQPLQQDLSDGQKELLSEIGDSLQLALTPNIDSMGYNDDYVLYKKIDTLISGTTYQDVYVYSNDPDSAIYRLGFSYVGENEGNYVQVQSSANGKVYQWIAPISGIPQGNYEPVVLLITPKKKQMVTLGSNYQLGKNTVAEIELGMTNNDINTFSSLDSKDNAGYALNLLLKQEIPLNDSSKRFFATTGYQMIDQNFDPIERFRNVEFERDWNISDESMNEHFLNLSLNYLNSNKLTTIYDLEYLNRSDQYTALRNNMNLRINQNGFKINASGSYLNSDQLLQSTYFVRHKARISKSISFITLGVGEEAEENIWRYKSNDSLVNNSFSFQLFEAFIHNTDTTNTKYFINYKNRKDHLPYLNNLSYAANGEDISSGIHFLKNKNNIFRTTFNYRRLSVIDSTLYSGQKENTVTGRIEHSLRLFKGAISTATFYETGSGMEVKREFSYVEVAPGQGVFQWTDYNGNGVKELDEFEIAAFQDQATYIRVFTPTNDYIRTANNQFSQMLVLMPKRIWRKEEGVKAILARFSDQFAYRTSRKRMTDDIIANINPFENLSNDSLLMSYGNSIRNTFSYNKTSPIAGVDYIFQNNRNRILLVNGLDTRTNLSNAINLRWNITKKITLIDKVSQGEKTYESEYFSNRNFEIPYIENEAVLRYQFNNLARVSLSYEHAIKENNLGDEKSTENNIGFELKYSVVSKSVLTINFNYIMLDYNSSGTTSVAYTMLEGLLPGQNATWSVLYQRSLSKTLQLNLTYNGRKSEETDAIHTGGVQLRAYF